MSDIRSGPVEADPDAELVRQLLRRDERAFRALIARYRDRLYNVALRMLGDTAEAEDLAQEVFITVFKSIDSFRGDAKLSTWLYRLTINHSKNRVKYLARRQDRQHDQIDDQHNSLPASSAPAADHLLDQARMDQRLEQAVRMLDEDQRLLVILRDVEDLSIEEIRQITGLVDGTIKSRLHRARLTLRKYLEATMIPPTKGVP